MSLYLKHLESKKVEIIQKMIFRENTSYYLIYGYHLKFQDIDFLCKIDNMIEKFLKDGKMVFNDITSDYDKYEIVKFLSFNEYITLVENEIMNKKLKIRKEGSNNYIYTT